MRDVHAPRLGRDVSAIGFGCASLGSRISAAAGHRAIDCAIDLGVTWFDVAPPYGDGHAETLLGNALQGRRDKVVICTKFGIAPPQISAAARLIRPLARRAVAALPGLRRSIAKARPVGTRAPIDPATIETSVIRSLRLLRTDFIDVLAVHEPSMDDAGNSAIYEVLHQMVQRGLVRTISIAGHPQSIRAAIQAKQPLDFAQFPDTPFMDATDQLRTGLATSMPMFVTHGVFGSGITQSFASLTGEQRTRLAALAEHHGIDVSRTFNDLLLRFAFSNNPDGVVIVSMFNASHMKHNVAAASQPPMPDLATALRTALS